MTPIALVVLAVVVIAPLIWSLRGTASLRGRREAALSLHRLQLAELDRDLAAERISPLDHATAKLEIERRILAADAETADFDPALAATQKPGRRWSGIALTVGIFAVPFAAFGLYMIHGHPELPGAPLAERVAEADRKAADEENLIQQLRARIESLNPMSEQARQGYVLLGNVEASLGHGQQAIDAWQHVLAIRFDAMIAAELAEAQSRRDGHVSEDSAALFRRALAEAPPDAPWRDLVEKRLAEAK